MSYFIEDAAARRHVEGLEKRIAELKAELNSVLDDTHAVLPSDFCETLDLDERVMHAVKCWKTVEAKRDKALDACRANMDIWQRRPQTLHRGHDSWYAIANEVYTQTRSVVEGANYYPALIAGEDWARNANAEVDLDKIIKEE